MADLVQAVDARVQLALPKGCAKAAGGTLEFWQVDRAAVMVPRILGLFRFKSASPSCAKSSSLGERCSSTGSALNSAPLIILSFLVSALFGVVGCVGAPVATNAGVGAISSFFVSQEA